MSGTAHLALFEELYIAHRGAVYHLCLSRLRDPSEAEDVTQEVFARALARGLDGIREVQPWLITIARNLCTDSIRRRVTRPTLDEKAATARSDRGELSADRIVASAAVISELLGRLTPAERSVAERAVIEDQSHAQVAAALGIGASTSRVLLSRACRRLRDYLKEHRELLGSWVSGPVIAAARRWRRRWDRRTSHAADRGLALAVPLVVATALIIAGGPAGGGLLPSPPSHDRAIALAGESPAPAIGGLGAFGRGEVLPGAIRSPGSPRHAPRPDPLAGLIPPPRQEDVSVLDLVASPNYASDHTILDVGIVNGCSPPPCYAAFGSTDGGRTWTYLPSRGLLAGQLIMAPEAFAAGRFFAFGSAGLQVTNDGGASFTTIAPRLPGFAAATVAGAPDDVVVSNFAAEGYSRAAAPKLLYSLGLGRQAQGPALFLADRQAALQPASDASDTSGRVHLLSCLSQCSDVASLPWSGRATLVGSPAYPADHTMVAASSLRDVAVSTDGGRTFTAHSIPAAVSIHSLAIVPTARGPRLLVLVEADGRISTIASDDFGGTWRNVPASPTRLFRPRVLRWLMGERLIEAGDEGGPATSTAFRCSEDSGTTWGLC